MLRISVVLPKSSEVLGTPCLQDLQDLGVCLAKSFIGGFDYNFTNCNFTEQNLNFKRTMNFTPLARYV